MAKNRGQASTTPVLVPLVLVGLGVTLVYAVEMAGIRIQPVRYGSDTVCAGVFGCGLPSALEGVVICVAVVLVGAVRLYLAGSLPDVGAGLDERSEGDDG